MSGGSVFTRDDLTRLLRALDAELGRRGSRGSVIIAGGAAMMYAFNARNMTADIDGMFQPVGVMRECIAAVAAREGVSGNWLNDGVKGFYNGETMRSVPLIAMRNLTVERLDDESLLALKLFAARDNGKDAPDARLLIERLGLSTPEQALDIVEARLPRRLITPDTQYFTQSVFETIRRERAGGRSDATTEQPSGET